MNGDGFAVLSASWARAPLGEHAAAARSIAGALSRLAPVDIFVPGDGRPFADGAFDVTPVGDGQVRRAPYRAVLLEADGGLDELARSAASLADGAPVLSVGEVPVRVDGVLDVGIGGGRAGPKEAGRAEKAGRATDVTVRAGGDPEPVVHRVGLYARVHPGASTRRHYGLGAVPDYLLVLGDRPGVPLAATPSDRTRWLLAGCARQYVVVVEGGVARAWRSRSCVAQFGVHTRMDLWILMARARAVVDLRPGEVYARECVEALRFGVPIVVPDGGAAGRLARAVGGMRYSSTGELLSCTEALGGGDTRSALASAGRRVADHWYGDPEGFESRLARALGLDLPEEGRPGGAPAASPR